MGRDSSGQRGIFFLWEEASPVWVGGAEAHKPTEQAVRNAPAAHGALPGRRE